MQTPDKTKRVATPMVPNGPAEVDPALAQADTPDNVNKIREIIFGSQMRTYEHRFEQLETRLAAEMARLKSDLELRLDRLENLVRKEVDETNEKIQKEKRDRNEAVDTLNKLLHDIKKSLSESIGDVDEKLTKTTSNLRNEMHQQGNEWSQRLNREVETLNGRVANDVNVLRNDKVARSDLGELLGEVALRLKDQFELPLK